MKDSLTTRGRRLVNLWSNQYRKMPVPSDPGDLVGMTDHDLGALRNWLASSEDLKPAPELRLWDIRREILRRGHTVTTILAEMPREAWPDG